MILSNDESSLHLNRIEVVQLTSNVDRLYPSGAYVLLGGEQRKAMADQLTTASKQRLIRKAGAISRQDPEAVERAVRVQLGLSSQHLPQTRPARAPQAATGRPGVSLRCGIRFGQLPLSFAARRLPPSSNPALARASRHM